MHGNPRCELCNGKGVVQTPHGWGVCRCVRGNPAQRKSQRRLNSIGTEYIPLCERIARQANDSKQP